jgi:hypothetical protein
MKKIAQIAISILLVLATPLYVFLGKVNAATLTSASVSLSDSRPSQTTVTYTFNFAGVTASNIKCIKIQFSDTATAGSKPSGMTLNGSLNVSSSTYLAGLTSWTPVVTDATGLFTSTHATGGVPGTGDIVMTAHITNGSTASTTYYARFNSYDNVDCATTPRDDVTLAFIYTDGVVVNATVDPTLTFSLGNVGSGQSVNSATTNVATSSATAVTFGSVTASTNRIAAHDLVVSTNAVTGYTVYTKYTAILTSGGNTITDHTGTNAAPTAFPSPGTEAFGYTTADSTLGTGTAARFTTSGGNKWAAYTTAFTTSNEVAYSATAVSSETTRVGYQVGVSATTEPGTYTTTVVYSAVPKY